MATTPRHHGTVNPAPLESDIHMHPLVSWRSVAAGLLVTFLALAILLALGMAFGGIGLVDGAEAQNAGIFTGIWFLVSAVISLFVGSYFATRISKFHTGRIGAAHGAVIAALFFGFFLYQSISAIGWAGNKAGAMIGSAGSGAAQVAGNPAVDNLVDDAVGDLNLRSDPQVVVSGVASRLMRGDSESAKNYLARQANLTPAEADARIAQLRGQVDAAMVQARETAARTMQGVGWSLFAALLLGSVAAMSGGALGSRSNLRSPLTREQFESVHDYGPATI